MCICIYAYIYMWQCVYMCMYTYVYVCVWMCIYTYIYTYISIHTVYKYIYTYCVYIYAVSCGAMILSPSLFPCNSWHSSSLFPLTGPLTLHLLISLPCQKPLCPWCLFPPWTLASQRSCPCHFLCFQAWTPLGILVEHWHREQIP